MVTRILASALLIMISINSRAQTDSVETKATWFDNINFKLSLGGLIEENELSGRTYTPTVSGLISYQIWPRVDVGLGIGYDEYHQFKARPIFAQLNIKALKKGNSPFIYAKGGKSKFWAKDHIPYDRVMGKGFYEFGLGYEWQFDKVRLNLGAGLRRQIISTRDDYGNWYWFAADARFASFAPSSIQITNWELNRTVFNIGLVF